MPLQEFQDSLFGDRGFGSWFRLVSKVILIYENIPRNIQEYVRIYFTIHENIPCNIQEYIRIYFAIYENIPCKDCSSDGRFVADVI